MAPVRPMMLPMRSDEVCRQMQVADLGALGFSLKSAFKKVGSALKKAVKGPEGVVRAIVAPITIGPTAIARGATWVAGKAGIPGAAKASDFMRKELDKQAAIVGTEAAIGAVVGGAIVAAPAIGAAATAAGSALTTGTVGTVVTGAATAAGKDLIKDAAGNILGGKPQPQVPTDVPVTEVSTTPYGPPLPPGYDPNAPRMLKAGMFEGPNLYVTVGGAMALGLIAYALYGTKKPAAAAAAAVAPGPLASLNRSRRSRRGSRRRARR